MTAESTEHTVLQSCTLRFKERFSHVLLCIDHLLGISPLSPANQYKPQINYNLQAASLESAGACRSREKLATVSRYSQLFSPTGFPVMISRGRRTLSLRRPQMKMRAK